MKTKYYIGIISLLLLSGSTLNGQSDDLRDYRNADAPLVINNYYNNNDYSFTSRINRFHRSYVAFDYYNPFFSDPYWYDYQPYSLGIDIYSGFGSGFGFGLGNDWGYNPYYNNNSYWGYNPFYYSNWYSPFYFNFGFRNRWHNDYYGWNGRSHYRDRDDFRPGYYSHNDRYGNNFNSGRFSHSVYPSRHNSGNNSESGQRGNIARRGDPSVNSSGNTYSNRNQTNRFANNNSRNVETRRNSFNNSNLTNRSGNGVSNAETRRNSFNNSNLTNKSGNGVSNAETRRFSYASVNQNNSSSRNLGNSLNSVNAGRSNGSGYSGRSTSRGVSTPQIHSSSSRSFNSGSGSKSMSSHSSSHSSSSSSKSSGSRSHSSGGRSSGRR